MLTTLIAICIVAQTVVCLSATDTCIPRQHIYAAMLWSRMSSRINQHVGNFTQLLREHAFQNESKSISELRFFPSVFSEACEKNRNSAGAGFDKGHGSNMAHQQVWESFYRRRRPCGFHERDVLLVFEYDAFLGDPQAIDRAVESVRAMQTEFHFFGYCFQNANYHPTKTRLAPYCLHAYAVTLKGAKKLLDFVDTCSFFADAQVAILADNKNLTWSYEKQHYDSRYIDAYFSENGIHISGPFLYDGIFVQAKFDHELASLKNGTVVNNKSRGKELHVLQNSTWRSIPNMDVFNSLGVLSKNIMLVSDWQFRKYPEGPPLSE